MIAFDVVAQKCCAIEGFIYKNGRTLRTRTDRLVRTFRDAKCTSLQSSGTSEEYKERDILLQDIVCRMDNWKGMSEDAKARERAKSLGIELSGELTMDEQEDEDEGDELEVDNSSNSPGQDNGPGQTPGSSKKRTATSLSCQTETPSKREKLGDATTEHEFLREWMHFAREDAAKRLAFEEKRMITEQEREARRETAELQRDRDNKEFMLKLLEIEMGKKRLGFVRLVLRFTLSTILVSESQNL